MNCIAPGVIDTPMRTATILLGGLDPKKLNLASKVPLGFEGDAWDVARAALFLAGPDGRCISGLLVPVDGGTTATSHQAGASFARRAWGFSTEH